MSMGVALGLITGSIAMIWHGMFALGLVVGLSLTLTLALATTLGFLIPYLLTRLGVDPAVGADSIYWGPCCCERKRDLPSYCPVLEYGGLFLRARFDRT